MPNPWGRMEDGGYYAVLSVECWYNDQYTTKTVGIQNKIILLIPPRAKGTSKQLLSTHLSFLEGLALELLSFPTRQIT